MKFHAFVYCTAGTRPELEQGMAGKRGDLYQRMLGELAEYARFCDEAGFEGFGHPEHHLQIEGMEMANEPGLLDMFLGMQTRRLRMDLFGYVLPTHNPLRVAEHAATLDHMLKGRLNIAFVRGYQARWFQCLGAVEGAEATGPWNRKGPGDDTNRAAFEEAVAIIKKAWTQDTFSHRGRFWSFPPEGAVNPHDQPTYTKYGKGVDATGAIREVGIAPRPYQRPHPPLYSGFTFSVRTALYWAREGGKPIVLSDDFDFCKRLWASYRETAATHGRRVAEGEEAGWGGWLLLAGSAAEAQAWAEDVGWFWEHWGTPFGFGLPPLLLGTPDDVSRAIEHAQAQVPFNECFLLLGQGLLGRDKVMKSLDLFATRVMPRFA